MALLKKLFKRKKAQLWQVTYTCKGCCMQLPYLFTAFTIDEVLMQFRSNPKFVDCKIHSITLLIDEGD